MYALRYGCKSQACNKHPIWHHARLVQQHQIWHVSAFSMLRRVPRSGTCNCGPHTCPASEGHSPLYPRSPAMQRFRRARELLPESSAAERGEASPSWQACQSDVPRQMHVKDSRSCRLLYLNRTHASSAQDHRVMPHSRCMTSVSCRTITG